MILENITDGFNNFIGNQGPIIKKVQDYAYFLVKDELNAKINEKNELVNTINELNEKKYEKFMNTPDEIDAKIDTYKKCGEKETEAKYPKKIYLYGLYYKKSNHYRDEFIEKELYENIYKKKLIDIYTNDTTTNDTIDPGYKQKHANIERNINAIKQDTKIQEMLKKIKENGSNNIESNNLFNFPVHIHKDEDNKGTTNVNEPQNMSNKTTDKKSHLGHLLKTQFEYVFVGYIDKYKKDKKKITCTNPELNDHRTHYYLEPYNNHRIVDDLYIKVERKRNSRRKQFYQLTGNCEKPLSTDYKASLKTSFQSKDDLMESLQNKSLTDANVKFVPNTNISAIGGKKKSNKKKRRYKKKRITKKRRN